MEDIVIIENTEKAKEEHGYQWGYDGELIQNIIIDGKYKVYTTAKYKYSYKDRRRHYIE